MTKNYAVNLWGSHPDLENDDCWMGEDFETKEEALAAFNDPVSWLRGSPNMTLTEGYYVEIDGPDIHEERPLFKGEWTLSKRQACIDDGLWASEIAWQDRMLSGCD